MSVDPPIRGRDRLLYNGLWLADHLLGEATVDRRLGACRARLKDRLRADLRAAPAEGLRPIPRVKDLSPREFRATWLWRNQPVVLEGAAAGWSAASWTPEALAARYPDDEVVLINAAPEDVDRPDFDPGRTRVAALVADMQAGKKTYARFNPLLQRHPELRAALDRDWLLAHTTRLRTGISYQLFMGGPGTATATHNAISNNLFVQLYGTKRWRIYPPSASPILDPPRLGAPYFFSRLDPGAAAPDPLLAHLPGYEAVLGPGDVLFNPSFWWHQVSNDTASIGVGFRWFAPWSIARSSLTQLLLTVMANNPPMWVARRHRQDFATIFSLTRRRKGAA